MYLALGLHAGESHLDEGEFLNVEKHSLQALEQMSIHREKNRNTKANANSKKRLCRTPYIYVFSRTKN